MIPKPRVLIVEDDDITADEIAAILRNSGFLSERRETLAEGIDLAAAAVLVISVLGLAAQYALVKRDLLARQQQLVLTDMAGFDAL